MYSNSAPTHSVPTIVVDGENCLSPLPIRGHSSPYARSLAINTGSGPFQHFGDSTDSPRAAEGLIPFYNSNAYAHFYDGYLHEQPRALSRASSRASSAGRNFHTGAEDSAQRGTFTIGVVTPSSSASPVSPRTMNFSNQNLGAEGVAQLGLGGPIPSRPPSRSRCREPRSPIRSTRPSRSRSRSPAGFACNGALKYDTAVPAPESAPPLPFALDLMTIPNIKPCVDVARYDRNVAM